MPKPRPAAEEEKGSMPKSCPAAEEEKDPMPKPCPAVGGKARAGELISHHPVG